jgi:hypothetical protein
VSNLGSARSGCRRSGRDDAGSGGCGSMTWVGVKDDVYLQQVKQVSSRRQGVAGVTLHAHLS